jgi:hypothetical protein
MTISTIQKALHFSPNASFPKIFSRQLPMCLTEKVHIGSSFWRHFPMRLGTAASDPLFSSSFRTRLQSGEVTIPEILREKSVIRCVKGHNRPICHFLASKASEIVQSACFSHEFAVRSNAINAIAARNPSILNAICESGELSRIAHGLISGGIEAEITLLGAFCQITEICLSETPSQIESSCTFVPDLVLLCEHDPVYRLLESVLKMTDDRIGQFLSGAKFIQGLVNRLAEKHCAEELYNLMLLCTKNWVLESECGTPETLSFIAGYIESVSGRVQAVQWKLLLELLHADRIEVMRPAFFEAIAAVSLENPDRICECQVNALLFLTAFYSLDENAARDVDNERLIGAVVGWFRDFPCHTIALEAVCRFMEVALVMPGLGEIVDRSFRPLVVTAGTKPNNRIQLSFAVQWVRQIRVIAQESETAAELISHPEMREFCQVMVADVDIILANEYGRSPVPASLPLGLCASPGFKTATIEV